MLQHLWKRPNGYLRGDIVEVRSATEIAATLDGDGRLDGLPFMPEMAPFCGRQFPIQGRASKTCVEGLGLRRMTGTVFLENLRCDGAAHDGCERGCLMFWKEAWLKPVPAGSLPEAVSEVSPSEGCSGTPRSMALALPTRSLSE